MVWYKQLGTISKVSYTLNKKIKFNLIKLRQRFKEWNEIFATK